MKRENLIWALRKLQVQTGGIACLGCGFERACCVNGCRLIRGAVETLDLMTWRPTAQRMPRETDAVLAIVYGEPREGVVLDGAYEFARYYPEDGWVIEAYPEWEDAKVTHWMPLPAEPEEVACGKA